ncbi:FAD:protein FMN transferase [Rheinheimera maricola]|uniref:FAD:protein FMN transferase n=1 Tax=Rheinheimera maricola TaxID=2793282 RepID=A0ABS7X5H4_9GAMM|nr:FAD:protein FMN transferase [Rheinheimera maricola]MBZ9610077.1 FAD:protein FMN transferase [Rheinheimera maricola]
MHLIRSTLFATLYLLISGIVCSNAAAQWHRQAFQTLGTQAYIELWDEDEAKAQQLITEVKAEFERINQLMSPYIDSSELSILNRLAAQQAVPVSVEMYQLLQQAKHISLLSNGAFDVTFASVGFYYDYRARKKPDASLLQRARQLVNYQSIELLQGNKVRYSQAGVKIDLGGIAKGYAVERGIALLAANGVAHAQLSAGGDSRLLGDKFGKPWLVAIKHPRQEHKYAAQIPLQDSAISTSGDYERYFIEDGVRYHHILDPKTGNSALGMLSVSVIGADTTKTDALSTTLFVLGLQQGMELIERIEGYEAIFIDANHKMHFSSGLTQ